MTEREPEDLPPRTTDQPRKAWVAPELEAFPMSEAENGVLHAGDNDGVTNDS
jgi:hypothetical protein